MRMYCNNFGDSLIFPLPTSAGQYFHLFSEISQHLLDGFAPVSYSHGFQIMYPTHIGDPFSFPLVPSWLTYMFFNISTIGWLAVVFGTVMVPYLSSIVEFKRHGCIPVKQGSMKTC